MFRNPAGRLALLLLAVFCLLGTNPSFSWGADFSAPGQAYNVDPPGQYGGFPPFPSYATDQLNLYDSLTPLFDQVTDADLPTHFKENVFGLGSNPLKRTESVPGHPDLVIQRDKYEVAHVSAPTRTEVMFGIGYVTAEDRTLLMDQIRGPGRIAALDAPGLTPFSITQLNPFFASQATEDFLASQEQVIEGLGPEGVQVIKDIDDYLEGINTWRTTRGVAGPLWTRNDVIAVAALFGGVFGKGGGDEARRSQLLSALQDRLGESKGYEVWNDLREQDDPEAPVSIDGKFRQPSSPSARGNLVLDAASLSNAAVANAAAAQGSQRAASNAILVGRSRSATGRPFLVAGPQVGYSYPGALYEVDAHGGGIDARGVTFPGSGPYVELGRGQDFSWSATSAGSDNIDIFVETLCGDDTHYSFKGACREMTTFDAGTVGFAHNPVQFKETVHGPVIGYATVDGARVALSLARTTRGREAASALGFADLNTNAVHDVPSFFDAANKIDFTFNWFYADHKDIAMFSSGRLPVRAKDVDMGLPTNGNGNYEWRGFLSQDEHPQGTEPKDGTITNWNNKPVAGWQAADDQWAWGSIHREQLLHDAIDRRQTHTLGSVVAAMNRAATQDLRDWKVMRAISAVLDGTAAPSARDQQMLDLLEAWRTVGSSRLDRDSDGQIDHPGAAIMDKAWPKIADAVMRPVLGPQLDQLASLVGRDNRPGSGGSAYISGWYGYVDKDLRTIAGVLRGDREDSGSCGRDNGKHRGWSKGKGHGKKHGHSKHDSCGDRGKHGNKHGNKHDGDRRDPRFATRFCGNGDLAACRASLWAAIDEAGNELQAAQGANPADWRSSATAERITFGSLFPFTMRWTNRPTFQQAISYSSHR
jgi:acyl-homoserine lactone acylase PvdQ